MKPAFLITLLVLIVCMQTLSISMIYCGFRGDYCGQSSTDDVNPNAKFVILAFPKIQDDGILQVDDANFPNQLLSKWQSSGKKVLLSIGGQNGIWKQAFASRANTYNFVTSLASIIKIYSIDGVNLDIDDYRVAPRAYAEAINNLRQIIGRNKLIIVSPEDVTIIQSVSIVPSIDTPGQPWNYFVPIINLAGSSIDYYQPLAYGNGYDSYAAGSVTYLQDLYLNWRNLPAGGSPIQKFEGVDGKKLLIGLESSPSADGSSFYATPAVINKFKAWIATNNFDLEGFVIWNSHWDDLNGRAISTVCSE